MRTGFLGFVCRAPLGGCRANPRGIRANSIHRALSRHPARRYRPRGELLGPLRGEGGRTGGPCSAARQGVGSDARAGNSGRVRIAGPGGRYRTVRADTVARHRGRAATDGFQVSADVTGPVRKSGPGVYKVARFKGAKSPSTAGTWGGWTLVAVYENKKEPLHRIAMWDGFQPLEADRRTFTVRLNGLHIPANSHGRAGVVAYDGYRGRGNDGLTVRAGRHRPLKVHDSANPANDVMNSTITDFGQEAARRPAYPDTLGFDSDVFDITPALRSGADRLTFRFTTRNPGYLLGALFVQADTRH